jgi:hypothetical protein
MLILTEEMKERNKRSHIHLQLDQTDTNTTFVLGRIKELKGFLHLFIYLSTFQLIYYYMTLIKLHYQGPMLKVVPS